MNKRFFLTLLLAFVCSTLAYADGGMWLMQQINGQVARMKSLGMQLEATDIYNPNGSSLKDAVVMLNITGGGELHFKEDKTLWYLKPDHVFPIDPDPEEVIAKTEALFA